MTSGGYDGIHPSSSYGHSESWGPSGSSAPTYDRPNFHHNRRHSPSPSRRYVPYDTYYQPENNYRPTNNYRPEDDDMYYGRSPSPEQYRAYVRPLDPDAWENPTPWGSVPAPWEDSQMASDSPTSSASKARRDSTATSRMFEPSDAWKQNHGDRPSRVENQRPSTTDRYMGDHHAPRTPNSHPGSATFGTPSSYVAPNGYPTGDNYRPAASYRDAQGFAPRTADAYRPGWSPSSSIGRDAHRRSINPSPSGKAERATIRSASRYAAHSRRVSGTTSNIGSGSPRRSSPPRQGERQMTRSRSHSHRSTSHGRPSNSRSRSRGRQSRSRDVRSQSGRRSISRGRRSLSNGVSSAGYRNSSSSPKKRVSSVKYSWDRPTSVSGASKVTTSPANGPAQSIHKSSWARSTSRSSIASTQASDRVSSPTQSQSNDFKGTVTSFVNTNEVKPNDRQEVTTVLIEMSAAPPEGIEATGNGNVVEEPPSHSISKPTITEILPTSQLETGVLGLLPSPLSHKGSPAMTQAFFEVNGATTALLPDKPAKCDNVDGGNVQVFQGASPPYTIPVGHPPSTKAIIAPSVSLVSIGEKAMSDLEALPSGRRNHEVLQKGDAEIRPPESVTLSLPTPQPTPKPTIFPGRSPSPPLFESIPTEAKSMREALRIVVMTRMLCDNQTREERVNPVLLSNLRLISQNQVVPPQPATPDEHIKTILGGLRQEKKMGNFAVIKGSLVERFEQRHNALANKIRQLKEEYLSLHERWTFECAKIDKDTKPAVSETESSQPSGRTTRRSTAIGDAVRSDLEMEQIIASLGNDELTDPNHLSLRNLATIPDMISVTNGPLDYHFDDTNHLVKNPSEYYGPHTGIHDWTDEEKEIFLDKFAAHPKQFGMIAEHLPNKTAGQCVDYYYLHKKKQIDFRKVVSQYAPNKRRRRGTGKKRGNGLLADIRQHDAEVHGEIGSPRSVGRPSRGRKPMPPPEPKDKEPKKLLPSRRRAQLDLTPSAGSATPTPEPESRRRGRRSAIASSSRTVSVSLEDAEEEATEEVERPSKRAKRVRKVKSAAIVMEEPSTPEPRFNDLTEPSSRRKAGTASAQWSEEDKALFLSLLAQHGDDFKRIAASMPNKTTIQVSNYYKTNVDELNLEAVAAGAPKRTPTPELQDVPQETPAPAVAIAASILRKSPEPMASLTPPTSHPPIQTTAKGTSSTPYQDVSRQTIDATKAASHWQSTTPARTPTDTVSSVPSSQAPPPGHVRGAYAYPVPTGRPPAPYSSHPMPTYAPPHPVAYPYPSYTAPYPQYDPMPTHHPMTRIPHPYSIPDHRRLGPPMSGMRPRENPYPAMPPGPPYHYSLESS